MMRECCSSLIALANFPMCFSVWRYLSSGATEEFQILIPNMKIKADVPMIRRKRDDDKMHSAKKEDIIKVKQKIRGIE